MSDKKRCHEKKCKKACVEFNYYYNREIARSAESVFDTYAVAPPGSPVSSTTFGYAPVFSNAAVSGEPVGEFAFIYKAVTNLQGQLPKSVVEAVVTGVLPDGVSSISFVFTFISIGPVSVPVGVYKATARGTGIFFDKDIYVTVVVPTTGAISTNLKVCDRKSCA